MPEIKKIKDELIHKPLNDLMEANDRLDQAIDETRESTVKLPMCWITQVFAEVKNQ